MTSPLLLRLLRFPRRVHAQFKWIAWLCRCVRWNRQPGVHVSEQVAFVSNSARLQICSDGHCFGGRIHLSKGDCISDGAIIAPYGGSIHLDENVFIGPYCVLYGHGGLRIGKNTMIAAHSIVIPANHDFKSLDVLICAQPVTKSGISIGEDVWIGCGVKVLDGVSIGDGCVVGAGAVVTKSLPDYSIAVGVPARVVGDRRHQSQEVSALTAAAQSYPSSRSHRPGLLKST